MAIKKLIVNSQNNYNILIGENLLQNAGEYIFNVKKYNRVLVVSDRNVFPIYGDILLKSLEKQGAKTLKYIVEAGEKSKSLSTYSEILSFCAVNELTRNDLIIALGGGVVGDLTGFVSATYLRGIDFIQIPTTLLAQIDSSVGAKTAINIKEGKNLVGAFKEPKLVLIDTSLLKTLPKEVFNEGMGEAIKYAFLSKEIYNLLQENYSIIDLIYACVNYKKCIVEKDEFESGIRRLLNFGHTVAHGIEKLSNYTIPHGTAVALGVKSAIYGAFNLKLFDREKTNKLIDFVEKNTCCGDIPYKMQDILKEAVFDKKRKGDSIVIAKLNDIGDVAEKKVPFDSLGEYFCDCNI